MKSVDGLIYFPMCMVTRWAEIITESKYDQKMTVCYLTADFSSFLCTQNFLLQQASRLWNVMMCSGSLSPILYESWCKSSENFPTIKQ